MRTDLRVQLIDRDGIDMTGIDTLFLLGTCQKTLGRLDLVEGLLEAAEKNFHRALEQTPGFVEAISYLGLVAEMRGGAVVWAAVTP